MSDRPAAVKRQVFVSYAHADDQPPDEDTAGWVSQFIWNLKIAVARQEGGGDVEFWMDQRLEPQRRVDEELRERVRESAVILAFFSPPYLESKWCEREMATFIKEARGGASTNRVFIVELLPTRREAWHADLRNLTPVQLWAESQTRPTAMTKGWPAPDSRKHLDYWDDVNYLGAVLAKQLKELGLADAQAAAQTAALSYSTPGSLQLSQSAATPEPGANSGLLSIVVHAADDEDPQLVNDTQALLGDLDADAYLAPPLSLGQTPAQHRAFFEQQLRQSHGVLVVYGTVPPGWVQAKHAEVRKLLALERRGTWAGLLEGPPETKLPHGLPPRGLMVLDCRKGPNRDELSRFVRVLREQRDAGPAHV